MASALHTEGDFAVVAQYHRSHVEAVGCHGCEADGVALRHDDGAAHAERIGGTACRCADDESVCLIGCQVFVVDVRVDGNHRRDVMFQDGNLVQCVRIVLQVHFIT